MIKLRDIIKEIKIDTKPKLKLKRNKETFHFSKEYTQVGTQFIWGNDGDEFLLLEEESGLTLNEYDALNPKDFHPRAYRNEDTFITINKEYVQIIDEVDEIKIDANTKLKVLDNKNGCFSVEERDIILVWDPKTNTYVIPDDMYLEGEMFEIWKKPTLLHPKAYADDEGYPTIDAKYVQIVNKLKEIKIDAQIDEYRIFYYEYDTIFKVEDIKGKKDFVKKHALEVLQAQNLYRKSNYLAMISLKKDVMSGNTKNKIFVKLDEIKI